MLRGSAGLHPWSPLGAAQPLPSRGASADCSGLQHRPVTPRPGSPRRVTAVRWWPWPAENLGALLSVLSPARTDTPSVCVETWPSFTIVGRTQRLGCPLSAPGPCASGAIGVPEGTRRLPPAGTDWLLSRGHTGHASGDTDDMGRSRRGQPSLPVGGAHTGQGSGAGRLMHIVGCSPGVLAGGRKGQPLRTPTRGSHRPHLCTTASSSPSCRPGRLSRRSE